MAELNLPEFPVSLWWKLREAFKKSVPKKITNTYLSTTVGVKEDSAAKYIKNFVKIGILDAEGVPTDIAYDWRDDDKYGEVCKKILESSYPEELLDVGPPPSPDEEKVSSWIGRHERLGVGAAKRKAAVYVLLAKADLQQDAALVASRKSDGPQQKAAAQKQRRSPVQREIPATADISKTNSKTEIETSINLNIQIHISSDATNNQIEAIFSSMAKHLKS